MKTARLGQLEVSALGFGCMAVSHVYGGGLSDDDARKTIDEVIDAGVTFLDTSDVYGKPRPGREGPAGTMARVTQPSDKRKVPRHHRNDVAALHIGRADRI